MLSPGSRLGPYEVTALIGQGGMGEVYRATDANLKRSVALKVLPASLAADADRLARFQREAEVLASLNHHNIAAIYGFERTEGISALVMELVEGPTLADRISQGALPLDEALGVARQITDALEAAHERGIVHRDLKPANVKVRPDGTVKVLDFGLAKALDGPVGQGNASQLPTITTPAMTQAGVILGTAAYMSPEQARGTRVDRRTDVWALGCVLYEMLTGRRAFDGDTVSDTLAAVLRGEPDWNALPAVTPTSVRRLLRRALTKNSSRRLADVADVRLEIDDATLVESTDGPTNARSASSLRLILAGLVGAVLVGVAGAGWWFARPAPDPPAVVRFEIPQPPGAAGLGPVRVSPDGRTVAFGVLNGPSNQIWARSIDSQEARRLEGTDGATTLFWSPDSQSIAFARDGRLLAVPASGGPPRQVAILPSRGEYYGSWGAGGDILLSETGGGVLGGANRAAASTPQNTGLLRVRAGTEAAERFRQPDASRDEQSYLFPNFLPDGNHYLFNTLTTAGRLSTYVGRLDSNEVVELPGIESNSIYSTSGHILFLRNGALVAQRFDARSLRLLGEAVTVQERIVPGSAPTGRVSAAGGVLAFAAFAAGINTSLNWFDRTGKNLGEAAPPGVYVNPELSKDDRFVAWDEGGGPEGETWVRDLARGLTTRLTSAPGNQGIPQWSPDGTRIAYRSDRDGAMGVLVSKEFGVVGDETVLLKEATPTTPFDWSLDGRYVAFVQAGDAWLLEQASGKPSRITSTAAVETNVRVSPDGRWLAYQSNEPGAGRPDEIYLHSIADRRRKLQVSTAGGYVPRWRRDGRELYYLAPDRTLVAVEIDLTGAQPRIGAPAALFRTSVPRGASVREYAVTGDGRFLISTVEEGRQSDSVTVMLNWLERLR